MSTPSVICRATTDDQPFESILYICWIIRFLYNPKHIEHSDQPQPRKPAMDKDNSLWGFKEIDPGIEEMRRDDFAEHERPGI